MARKRRRHGPCQGETSEAPDNLLRDERGRHDFRADRPNEKRATDVTELRIPAGKACLSPIVDCFDGMPPGWSISTSPDAEMANSSLLGACELLGEGDHPLTHGDRGCRYRWPGWIGICEKHGLARPCQLNNVGTVTQMTNSAEWFHRSCASRHPSIPWTVFLGYDTDAYNSNITKFHEGDWARLRLDIEPKADAIIDLAAEADIEDIMLCDYAGVLSFLGLPADTDLPNGRKGKARMKKLHKKVAPNKPYHEGDKARPLIRALDMDKILKTAPIPLVSLEAAIIGPA